MEVIVIDKFKEEMYKNYYKTVVNMLEGNEVRASRFFSALVYATQRNPKLLECTKISLLQSFMSCVEYDLMPSSVSGESYIIPYENSKKNPDGTYTKVIEAQFQLGYQGLVTLFYRAGVRSIRSEIVRENDDFTRENGEISHKPDHKKNNAARGAAIGAYVIVEMQQGGKNYSYMHKDDILAHAKRFSKSFSSKYSPWNESNDPELWMWKKTVLKQAAKLVSKNDSIHKAISIDDRDSVISDRLETARSESAALTIGALTTTADDAITYEKED